MMSHGPEAGPQLLVIPPLFEELNRTRKLLSDVMRVLAANGFGSHLPDLPGTGESAYSLGGMEWADWQAAVNDADRKCRATAILSVRGGCLLDDAIASKPVARFSPVEGKRLIRDLIRARSLNDADFDSMAQGAVFTAGPTLLGGYPLSAELACAVRDADIPDAQPATIVRLENEPGDADIRVAGPPLWRRAEPTGSDTLTGALVDAIAEWLG